MSTEEGVRATNDDASQCKRFAVDKGYWNDPYISLFTPKAKQSHAPEISIGYYARVKGLRLLLERFIAVSTYIYTMDRLVGWLVQCRMHIIGPMWPCSLAHRRKVLSFCQGCEFASYP